MSAGAVIGCPVCGRDIDKLGGNPDCATCAAEPAADPCDHSEWAPACPFCGEECVAIFRQPLPPVASPRKFIVASFDVTDLTPAEVGALATHVEAQAEGDDDYRDVSVSCARGERRSIVEVRDALKAAIEQQVSTGPAAQRILAALPIELAAMIADVANTLAAVVDELIEDATGGAL